MARLRRDVLDAAGHPAAPLFAGYDLAVANALVTLAARRQPQPADGATGGGAGVDVAAICDRVLAALKREIDLSIEGTDARYGAEQRRFGAVILMNALLD